MKAIFCGDREWNKQGPIDIVTAGLFYHFGENGLIIVHGNCRGADRMAGKAAVDLIGVENVHVYPAEWNKYGNAAGPVRNRQMLYEERPDLVIGFHNNLEASSGTKDMLTIAKEAGVPAYLFSEV